MNTQGELVLPFCQTWWEEKVRAKPTRCNGGRVIRYGRCTCMHVAYFLFISLSVTSFISGSYSVVSLFHTSSLLQLSFCLFLFLSRTQTLRWLFLAGWVWKCAMINMLPWLLILSNGSVKLQCLDKYRRWRNICGAAQRHNEGKQLELIGYNSMRAAVVFRHRSKASTILQLSAYAVKSQTLDWLKYVR